MSAFDTQSLHTAVLAELAKAEIPADKTLALFAAADTTGKLHAVVAVRGGEHWKLELAGDVNLKELRASAGAVAFSGSW